MPPVRRRPIWLKTEERTAVDVEGLANPSQGIAHRVIDPIGGQVDEARGQLGDETLELEVSFGGRLAGALGLPADGVVDDDNEGERAAIASEGAQADADRKLKSVAAPPEQFLALRSVLKSWQERLEGLAD